MVVEWIICLTYPQPLLDKPIIYHLIRQFDLLANIREAHVNSVSGWLILSLRGDQETIQKAIEWMSGQGLEIEVRLKEEET